MTAADEGISGTNTKKRDAFNRLLFDAEGGRIDQIITKEVSRFARNTVDALQYTRHLKKLGIGVLFLNDNIDTLSGDGELRLTIMASIAQEESRKTSDRVKWGQKQRMEQGVVFGNRRIYGYTLEGGVLRIREDQAAVVRDIFTRCALEGQGTHLIAKALTAGGVPTPGGAKRWSPATVLGILRNEKYVGDLLQKKFCTPDYLSHKKVENRGQETRVFLPDHHEALVSRPMWDKAQQALDSRRSSPVQPSRHSVAHWCSGKLLCGICGHALIPRTTRRADGTPYRVWVCPSCPAGRRPRSLNHQALNACMTFVLEQLALDYAAAARSLLPLLEDSGAAAALRQCRARLALRERRAMDAYLEGLMDAAALAELQAACRKQQLELQPPPQEAASLPLALLTQGLEREPAMFAALIRRVTVLPPSLRVFVEGVKPAVQLNYSAQGRGEDYRVEISSYQWSNFDE